MIAIGTLNIVFFNIPKFAEMIFPVTAPAILSLVLATNSSDYYSQLQPGTTPDFLDNYSAFKIFAGVGPYSARRSSGIPSSIPSGYKLDQVVMFHRHGERYPTKGNSEDYENTLAKINQRTSTPPGYEFLHSWTYYGNQDNYGTETTTGPFSGIEASKKQGERFFQRYGQLAPEHLRIWTSDSGRVEATARAFANTFFQGRDDLYDVVVVPETKDANSLTPKCKGPAKTTCDHISSRTPEFDLAAQRIGADLGITLNAADAEYLINIALYEINVRGNSPWLKIFTPEEFVAFEYIRSYRVFCQRAHGSPVGLASGSILSNATAALLSQGPGCKVQNLTFAFLHDTEISEIVGATGLLNQTNVFDSTRVTFGNQIEISDIVPMGASLSFERITNDKDHYVRVLLNEAIVPIDWCSSGPGYSCPLDQFVSGIHARFDNFGWTNNCKKRHHDDPTEFTVFWE